MSKTQRNDATQTQRYLTFSLRNEEYAVPLLAVKEVIAMPEVTPVPHTPPHFLGIMNLRGQVVSVVDLRLKFGMKAVAEKQQETGVIIFDFGDFTVGGVVCSINSVLTFSGAEIQPKPEVISHVKTDYITGVAKKGEKLIVILDVVKAFDMSEKLKMSQTAQQKAA
jgi:purine-binding chemotaxis protein CheW